MFRLIIAVLLVCALATGALADTKTINAPLEAGDDFFPTLLEHLKTEAARRYDQGFGSFVINGGLPATDSDLTIAIPALTGFARGYYVDQEEINHTFTAQRRTWVYAHKDDADPATFAISGGDGCTFDVRDGHLLFVECDELDADDRTAGIYGLSQGPIAPADSMPLFYVDTDVDNVWAVQDLRKFNAERSDVIYVTHPAIGAKCDDNTDDTSALSAAMGLARAGAIVQLPEGVCRTSGLNIVQRGITLRGMGAQPTNPFAGRTFGSKLRAIDADQDYVLRVISQHVRIEDLSLDGDFKVDQAVLFFESSGSSPHQAVVERILVERAKDQTGTLMQLGGELNLQVDYVYARNISLVQDSSGGSTKAAYGMLLKNTNTFLNKLEFIHQTGANVGFEIRAGGANLINTQAEGNVIANYQINGVSQPVTFRHCYSETPNVPMFRWLNPINPNRNVITIQDCTHSSTGQSTVDWYLTQPTLLIGSSFNTNSFSVKLLEGDDGCGEGISNCDRHRITAITNHFEGVGVGFGGAGIQSVDEINTSSDDGTGVVTYNTTFRNGLGVNNEVFAAGQIEVPGSLTIGSEGDGTPVTLLQGFSYPLNFGTIGAGLCEDSPDQPLEGVLLGHGIGFENSSVFLPAGLTLRGYVKTTDTVIFRICNNTAGGVDPDSAGATYEAYLIQP